MQRLNAPVKRARSGRRAPVANIDCTHHIEPEQAANCLRVNERLHLAVAHRATLFFAFIQIVFERTRAFVINDNRAAPVVHVNAVDFAHEQMARIRNGARRGNVVLKMRGAKARQKLRLGFKEIDELALEVGNFAAFELSCGNKAVAHRLHAILRGFVVFEHASHKLTRSRQRAFFHLRPNAFLEAPVEIFEHAMGEVAHLFCAERLVEFVEAKATQREPLLGAFQVAFDLRCGKARLAHHNTALSAARQHELAPIRLRHAPHIRRLNVRADLLARIAHARVFIECLFATLQHALLERFGQRKRVIDIVGVGSVGSIAIDEFLHHGGRIDGRGVFVVQAALDEHA